VPQRWAEVPPPPYLKSAVVGAAAVAPPPPVTCRRAVRLRHDGGRSARGGMCRRAAGVAPASSPFRGTGARRAAPPRRLAAAAATAVAALPVAARGGRARPPPVDHPSAGARRRVAVLPRRPQAGTAAWLPPRTPGCSRRCRCNPVQSGGRGRGGGAPPLPCKALAPHPRHVAAVGALHTPFRAARRSLTTDQSVGHEFHAGRRVGGDVPLRRQPACGRREVADRVGHRVRRRGGDLLWSSPSATAPPAAVAACACREVGDPLGIGSPSGRGCPSVLCDGGGSTTAPRCTRAPASGVAGEGGCGVGGTRHGNGAGRGAAASRGCGRGWSDDGGTAAGDVLARLEEEVRFIGWEVGGAATDLCGWVSEYRL